jgi:SsrA-binding protein
MGFKIIAQNKKAGYDYFLQEKFEAGLELQGTEVKSLRAGKVSIMEAYVSIDKKFEAWLYNMTIPHYEFGNINNHKECRKRKLLLHKKEIIKIEHLIKTQKLTVIPTKIYFKSSIV